MRRTTESLGAWALALALGACGSPAEPSGDGGARPDGGSAPDAALADGGATLDAGMLDGAEPDSGPSDAGPPDRDSDGVPDEEDCAPDDTGIGREASRSCSTACGDGVEDCESGVWADCTAPTDCLCFTEGARRFCSTSCGEGVRACFGGVWGECDAPTDCVCDTEGARRIVPCGNCGEQAEECRSGMWEPASSCLSEGACEPATVQQFETTLCRLDERLCRSDCTWGEWSTLRPEGECYPDSNDCDGTSGLDRLCTDECSWVDDPSCLVNP